VWACAAASAPAGRVASASLTGRTVERDLEKDEHMLGESIKNLWVALVVLAGVMVLVANKEATYQWVLWALGRKRKVKAEVASRLARVSDADDHEQLQQVPSPTPCTN
jgi:hypothetical protein